MTLKFLENVALSKYSTFKIGGAADYLVSVTSDLELLEALRFAKSRDLPFMVVGKGSNCLFDDAGFRGLIIINKLMSFEQVGPLFTVGAGYSFSQLGRVTAKSGYGGLEFASGIPGTVGGAVYMNAGANQKETADHLEMVSFVDEEGAHTVEAKALKFAYRYSSFQENEAVITGASFRLIPFEGAREQQYEIIERRKQTQPLQEPSCGCIFRNPPQDSAGRLIEQAQLKGRELKGVSVSRIHGNFIVNQGQGSSGAVRELVALIREEVRAQFNVELESEVNYVPPDPKSSKQRWKKL